MQLISSKGCCTSLGPRPWCHSGEWIPLGGTEGMDSGMRNRNCNICCHHAIPSNSQLYNNSKQQVAATTTRYPTRTNYPTRTPKKNKIPNSKPKQQPTTTGATQLWAHGPAGAQPSNATEATPLKHLRAMSRQPHVRSAFC